MNVIMLVMSLSPPKNQSDSLVEDFRIKHLVRCSKFSSCYIFLTHVLKAVDNTCLRRKHNFIVERVLRLRSIHGEHCLFLERLSPWKEYLALLRHAPATTLLVNLPPNIQYSINFWYMDTRIHRYNRLDIIPRPNRPDLRVKSNQLKDMCLTSPKCFTATINFSTKNTALARLHLQSCS
jgi:hypothetical protein